MGTFTETYLREAVARVKWLLGVKCYLTMIAVGLVHAAVLLTNLNLLQFTLKYPDRCQMRAWGYPLPPWIYYVCCLLVCAHVTAVGLSVLGKYHHLRQSDYHTMRLINALFGILTLALLTGVSQRQRVENCGLGLNNVFFFFMLLTGCLKRGYDYNLKRLHRPVWTGGPVL